MSRVFSFGMATVLILMSLAGPMQPASAMEDAPQELTPMSGEVPLDDASDGDDAITEVPVETETPPAEDEDVAADDENLAPLEEPAEDANSPPADDPVVEEEPVVEELTVEDAPVVEDEQPIDEQSDVDGTEKVTDESDEMVIVPNAVDPEPGECPIDEPCDGGGGGGDPITTSVRLNVQSQVGLSAEPLPFAVLEISEGTTFIGSFTTNDAGFLYVDLKPDTTYTVIASGPDHETGDPASITPTGENDNFFFTLLKTPPSSGTATLEVVDARTQQPLVGAEIRLVVDRTWSDADSGTSDADGIWTTTELPRGMYWASVTYGDDQYHSQYDIAVSIPASNTIRIELQPILKSPISLKFVNANTDEPVAGAHFELALEGHGTDVEDFSTASGEYTTIPLEHGNYGINVFAEGYGYVTNLRFDHPAGGSVVIELQPLAPGTVTFKLIDDQTGDPLPNAYITIFEGDFGDEIVIAQTDENGEWTTPELPGAFYSAAIYPEYHYSLSTSFTVTNGNQTLTLEFSAIMDVGYLNVHVVDKNFGIDVHNAKITVRERGMGVVGSGLTDENGEWHMMYLPAGQYIVTVEKHGYITEVIEFGKSNMDHHLKVELQKRGRYGVRFWLRLPKLEYPDRTTHLVQPIFGTTNGLMPKAFQIADEYLPVAGANVQLLNPDTMEVVAETTSGEDGLVDLGDVMEGDYILQITGEGFEDYSAPFTVTEEMEFELNLTPSQATNPEPGEGDDDAPTNPEPGDGDDDTPTNPEPGDGGDDTPANPEPGNGDDNTTPDTGTPNDDAITGTGEDEAGDSGNPDVDTDADESAGVTDADAVAQTTGTTSDTSTASVNHLPNTGAGESQSHIGIAALTLVAAFTLLGALEIRRRI